MFRIITSIHLMCALVLVATPLFGQVSTGRQRAVVATTDERPGDANGISSKRWFFSIGAGVLASGNLFRVDSNNPGQWLAPSGSEFNSDRFMLVLDEDVDLNLALGRRLGDRAWLRLNVSTAQMNMRARARVGERVLFYRWDQMSMVLLGLDVEYRLVKHTKTPYLMAGCGSLAVKGSRDAAIDQTQLAIRFGGGYHVQLSQTWGLRAEIRNNLASLDFSQFKPKIAPPFPPPAEISIGEKAPHHFWEILVSIQGFL